MAINGDVAVVGAYQDADNGTNSGSAYVFVKPGGGWSNTTETGKLTASDGSTGDEFGRSVAISGDVAVIGAFGDDVNGSVSGSVYVFQEPSGGWGDMTETAKLTASDGDNGDHLGKSVSIVREGILAGAYHDDDNGTRSGSAYLFREPTGGWVDSTEDEKITASDGAAGDWFGNDVSIFGDFGVVGAHFNDDNGSASGSAYVFDGLCPCPWDLDGDGSVGATDLLGLLVAWGTDPGGPPDFDGDGNVGSFDLLALLANWGLCPCVEGTPPMSIEDEMADACLTMDDWNEFVDVMTDPESSEEEKDNYNCWMTHYLEDCTKCICIGASGCPGPDPFD